MKLTSRVGGILLLAVLLVLAAVGFATATGTNVAGNFGGAFSSAWAALKTVTPNLRPDRAAGNALLAAFIGLVLFAAGIIFVAPTRGGRGLLALAVLSVVAGLVLYQPSLIGVTA